MKLLIFAIVAPLLLVVACEKSVDLSAQASKYRPTNDPVLDRLPTDAVIITDYGNNWYRVNFASRHWLYHYRDSLNGNIEILQPW